MVNRFEMWNGQKLLLFIFNSNQKEQLFVWPTKCVVEELKGNTWYFSEIIERKSSAQFSETSITGPHLHHEVTLVVIGSHPNTSLKHYASLKKR